MTSAPPIFLQANAEKVVTAGWVSNGSDNDFFIARYVGGIGGASPTLRVRPQAPSVFQRDGNGGQVHPPYTFGSGNGDVAYGVAIQPDGRIVAAGSTTTPGSGSATDFAVARYKLPAGLRRFAADRMPAPPDACHAEDHVRPTGCLPCRRLCSPGNPGAAGEIRAER